MFGRIFSAFSRAISSCVGNPLAFILAAAAIAVWGLCGPFLHYSETWQMIVNTTTTIITFLMLFVLQNSQNRDSKALQTKLDELIRSSAAANKFIGAEKMGDQELLAMKAECEEASHAAAA